MKNLILTFCFLSSAAFVTGAAAGEFAPAADEKGMCVPGLTESFKKLAEASEAYLAATSAIGVLDLFLNSKEPLSQEELEKQMQAKEAAAAKQLFATVISECDAIETKYGQDYKCSLTTDNGRLFEFDGKNISTDCQKARDAKRESENPTLPGEIKT